MSDKKATIQELKEIVNEFRGRRGWENNDLKDVALSLVLESAEVMELFQWMDSDEVENSEKMRKAVGEELTDVLWWVLVMVGRLDIDLTEMFNEKMKKRDKKYPLEIFGSDKSGAEKKKAYYKIKARTRGGHPLAEQEDDA